MDGVAAEPGEMGAPGVSDTCFNAYRSTWLVHLGHAHPPKPFSKVLPTFCTAAFLTAFYCGAGSRSSSAGHFLYLERGRRR